MTPRQATGSFIDFKGMRLFGYGEESFLFMGWVRIGGMGVSTLESSPLHGLLNNTVEGKKRFRQYLSITHWPFIQCIM